MLIRAVGGVARAHLIIYQGEKNTRSTVIGLRKPEDGPGVCLDERRYPRVLGGHFIGGTTSIIYPSLSSMDHSSVSSFTWLCV